MIELGYFALIVAFFTATYALVIDLLGTWRREDALIKSGRNATLCSWFCLTVSTITLWVLLVQRDFSVMYVAEHVSKSLPLAYCISAFWAYTEKESKTNNKVLVTITNPLNI